MKPLVLLSPVPASPFSLRHPPPRRASPGFPTTRLSLHSETIAAGDAASRAEYKPGAFDDLLLNLFRSRMVKEVGWDSEKPGYDGLIEVAHRLMMKGSNNSDTRDAAGVCEDMLNLCLEEQSLHLFVVCSLFPVHFCSAPMCSDFTIAVPSVPAGALPIARRASRRRKASCNDARVTALTCQWLMGKCTVNSVDLPDGASCQSGVFVERCKYLEESKCVGICVNTCKLPTQSFFKDYMGVPLLMEPNFEDYSCQFKFGIHPPRPQEDAALKEPCLEICPNAIRRREVMQNTELGQCPKA
ncbi:beta-carotene isomerase D27, chloroplastic isoform X1 [Syzygium oleosum]|uniref:beta-carotene isomerase D27, chloroplastic isoform X1 n=1 Tax=Syzygium oleosum TaxID=219896 RepID=UPI0024B8BF58|nr:beta-carotene isomerase D27, chloroplastic isoform X1 [Syzygium oleosum]